MNKCAYRIIDANANRAGEGLRVIEDILRFNKNGLAVFKNVKELRNRLLKQILSGTQFNKMLNARNAADDIGKIDSPKGTASVLELLISNFKRTEQALRSLEESYKLVDKKISIQLQALRFQVYSLEKEALAIYSRRRRKLTDARLYVILSEEISGKSTTELARKFIASGADIVQLREKFDSDKKFYKKAEQLKKICERNNTLFIINDRLDIALAVEADGVHTGNEDIPPDAIRKLIGTELLLGITCNDMDSLTKKKNETADYYSFGPVFSAETKKKSYEPAHRAHSLIPYGIKGLKTAVKHNDNKLIFAIGGINLNNISQIVNIGLRRVVVSSAVICAKSPVAAVNSLKKVIMKG